jgi:hypothetical protein
MAGDRMNGSKDRILLYAIIFSAVWHIFWLSMFSVTVTPKIRKPVKFSSVSFLGPILNAGVLSVDIKPRESTAAEARYLDLMGRYAALADQAAAAPGTAAIQASGMLSASDEEEFTALAISAIDTNKAGPGREVL